MVNHPCVSLAVAISREYCSRLRNIVILSELCGIPVTIGGIFLPYFLDVPSGARIILVAAGLYGLVLIERGLRKNKRRIIPGNT
ncbi:MAG: metal ABC transporter permease [Methanomicrobiales archaeon]